MVEVVGDASRDGRWALVRLTVEGDRIVGAQAEGLARPLEGLTLLEAAAVGGDELAVDALANALGPVFRAAPDPRRVAVAMSGGVDSAVALLKAGPHAIGVTLRLWLDPEGPDSERACCSPEAVLAARATCHALGLPHVTLDLREEFRRAVVGPFVRGYAAGETPNPCIRCNGSFRFDELLDFAERAGAAQLATGHYARIAEHRGRLLLARAADERKDQSYMLAGLDPDVLDADPLPARRADEGAKRAPRRPAQGSLRPGAQRARRPASSPAATTAAFSSGAASSGPRARSSTQPGTRSAGTTASGASPRASAEGSASPAASRSTRCAAIPGRTRSSSGRAPCLPCGSSRRAAGCTSQSSAWRRSCDTSHPPWPPARFLSTAVSDSSSTSPPTASPRARRPFSTSTTSS